MKRVLSILALLFCAISARSQVTFDNVPPLSGGGNTAGGVSFNFTTNAPITVNYLRCAFSSASGVATIWYNPNKINGAPVVTAANGWINLGSSASFAGLSPATTSPVVQTIPVPLNLAMNAQDTFGFFIQWTGNVYPTTNTNIPTFTNGTVTIIADANSAYTGTGTTPTFNPRQINGGVIYTPKPVGPNNASASQITEPANFCQGTLPVKLKVKNTGNNLISSLKVDWLLDGVAQPQINLSTPIDTFGSSIGNELIVTLGNVAFANAPRTIKAWTSLPNGVVDTVRGDDTVSVTLQAALSGVYTIGGTNPDFATITAAATALNTYGVCGPVTMNVRSGSYTGQQASLQNVSGTSAVNRITFKSEANSAAAVTFTANNTTSAANYIFNLNGTSFVTIRDLTLATTHATYGRAVVLNGGCTADSVVNCVMNLSAGTTSSNEKAGIAVVGLNDSNYFAGNTINNASYGIYQYGVSTTSLANGNVYENNTISNPYAYGIYAYYNNHLKFRNNTITRAAAAGTFYAFFSYYGDGAMEVSGNNISITGATGAAYGINQYYSDASTAEFSRTLNNVINISGSTDVYGLRIQYCSNHNCLNNTVRVASSSATSYAGYMYHSSTTYPNNVISNNIFWNDASTGVAFYNYNPTYGLADYNNVFGGANLFQRGTPALTTSSLSTWRTTTLSDRNTLCYRPGLMSATNLAPNPADTAVWSIHGRGIQVAGNDRDINGGLRPVTLAAGVPDLGAYEFVPTSTPPLAIASPAAPVAGSAQAFTFGQDTVAVLTWGAASQLPTSLAVRQYSGVVPPALPPGSFMYFYTDVAAVGSGLDYSADIYYKDPWKGTSPVTESTIRMATKSGAAAWVSYPGAASSVEVNRNILSVPGMSTGNWYTGRVDNCTGTPAAATITNAPIMSPLCVGQSAFLNASDNANLTAGIIYRWQSAPSATGPWTDVAGATSLSYVTAGLSATTYFRIVDTCVASAQGAASAAYMVPVANPQVTGTTAASRCGPGTVTLTATGTANTSLRWYAAATGGAVLFNGANFTTPNLTSTTTYYVEGYEGLCVATPRLAVIATVTPGPVVSIADTLKLCNGEAAELSVTSPLGNFDSYSWTPITNLYNDPAATVAYTGTNQTSVYFLSTASGLYNVRIQGTNSTTQCTGVDTARVYVMPAAGTVNATKDTICVSDTSTLLLAPAATYAPGVVSWQSSPDGLSWTTIPGAANPIYATGTITSDTFFRAIVRNGLGAICFQDSALITRIDPQIDSTHDSTRCGPGQVALYAQPTPGSTINWYASATGGLPIFTGPSFLTPILPATTTYYAAATIGGAAGQYTVGPVDRTITNGSLSSSSIYQQQFTVFDNILMQSVDIYSTASVGTANTVRIVNATTNVQVASIPFVTTVTGSNISMTIPLNVPLGPGNYYMAFGSTMSAYGNTGVIYPFTSPYVNITGFSGTAGWYHPFYNWKYAKTGCESGRTPITATITPSAAFSVTDTQAVCNNGVATLSVLSPAANYNQVTWTPITNLYSNTAATTPYAANTNASTVYARTTTPGYTYYVATGLNTANNCQGMDTSVVFTQPTVNISALPDTLCVSGSSTLSLVPASPYFPNTLSWFNSTDNGVTYNAIANATGSVYTTPTITDTTWYRIRVKNSAGAICQDRDKAMIVKIPTLTDTTNGTRCGVGPVVLGATTLPGYQPNWYTAATGGQPIYSGTAFTTPTLFNSTTYYVAAGSGSGGSGFVGPVNPAAVSASGGGTATPITTYYVGFDVLAPTTLLSVDVFPTAAIGSASTIVIQNSANTTIATVPYTTTVTGGTTPQTVMLNVALAPGTGYKMGQGTTSIALYRNTTGAVYPYTSPAINITMNNFSTAYYYYFYNWRYSSGCESGRIPVTATVTPAPAVSVTPKVDSICYGQSASFVASSANPGYQYTWNPVQVPGPVLNIQPGASSTYYLAVLDTSTNPLTRLCTWYDTVRAVVLPNPVADVLPQSATTFCAGDSVRLNTPFAPDYTYQWKRNGVNLPGALDSTIVVSAAGTYTVEVVKAGFCTTLSDPELITVNPLPNPVISINNGILYTGNYVAYQWLRGGQTVLGATGQQFVPTQNGDYSVAVTDANGCSNTSSIWRVSNTGVAVSNGIGGVVSVSPNPTTGVLTISSPVKVDALVTTLDGRVVLRQGDAKRVDLGAIADGVYFLRIVDASDGALLKSEKILKAQ